MAQLASKISSMCQRKIVRGRRESRKYMPGGWVDEQSVPFMGNIPDACRNYSNYFPRRGSSDSNKLSVKFDNQQDICLIPSQELSTATTVQNNDISVDNTVTSCSEQTENQPLITPVNAVSETAKILGDKVCCGCGRIRPTYLSKMFHSVDDYYSSYDSMQLDVRNLASALTTAHFDLAKKNMSEERKASRCATISDHGAPRPAPSPCSTNPDIKKCVCSRCNRKRSKCNRRVRFSDDLTNSFSRIEMWVASMDSTNPQKRVYDPSIDGPSQQLPSPTSSSPSPTDTHMSSPSHDDGIIQAAINTTGTAGAIGKMTESISSEQSSILTGLIDEDDEIDNDGTSLQVPIVGYEVMEQRARFTVFKVHVQRSRHENWFVFRRYTDFVQLNDKLKEIFPSFRLSLPPKRWFGSNFDENFLEDRAKGLQAFLNNVTGHRDVSQSKPVRQFLCLDDPPGPHDSLEESRALCESLEESVYNMRRDLQERDSKIELLEGEIAMYKAQIDALNTSLRKCRIHIARMEREYHRRQNSLSTSKPPSECSLGDMEDTDAASCVEADLYPNNKHRPSSENSVEWEINRNVMQKDTSKKKQNHNTLPVLDASGDASMLVPS